ncbi:MAG: AAA family ATPase [Nitriliruptorales bacterium]
MIVVADPDPGFRSRVSEVLEDAGGVAYVEDADELTSMLSARDGDVDAILVGPGLSPDAAFDFAEWLKGTPTGVLVVVDALTSDVLRRALRTGVRDVLPRDVDAWELREAVNRALAESADRRRSGGTTEEPTTTPSRQGAVISVFSTKGGCGKSVVASNLAVLLSRCANDRVALVDLDLESGDLAIMYQVLPALTIFDAAEKLERLDTEALGGYLTGHESGVDLLAAPPEPSLAGAVSGDAVRTILDLLRASYPYVVIDGPPSFTDQFLAGLDVTDDLVMVTTLDVPSVKNLKLALQTLEQLGWSRNRQRLLLNRADSSVGLRVRDVERTIGTNVDVQVPSSRDIPLSVNEGTPLAAQGGRSPVIDALASLAGDLHLSHTDTDDDSAAGHVGFLRRMLG